MRAFQLSGLEPRHFAPLFDLPDAALAERGIARCTADRDVGFPCRVSLEDAGVGEELLLLPWEHHAAASPYRASGPIFVRRGRERRVLAPGEVPVYVTRRPISMRTYDGDHMMVAGEVVDGPAVADGLVRAFADPAIAYVHLHHAGRGCFLCVAERPGRTPG